MNYDRYILSLGLENLKRSTTYYAFRCPKCGHTQSKRNATPAYILGLNTDYPIFYCHRCGYKFGEHNSLGEMLEELNYSLYQEYQRERAEERMSSFLMPKKEVVEVVSKAISSSSISDVNSWLKSASQLKESHPAVQYLRKRRIPENKFNEIFYIVGNGYSFFKKVMESDKYDEKNQSVVHEGLLFPFLNESSELEGMIIRFLNPKSDFRFLNLFAEKQKKFLGENRVRWDRKIYVVEGVMDKMSFENDQQVLAMMSTNQKIERLKEKGCEDVVYIYDYEYDNRYIEKAVKKVLDAGYKIFLWDQSVRGVKDMNDLRMKGWDDEKLFDYINKNTFSGMLGEMEFKKRQKIFYGR